VTADRLAARRRPLLAANWKMHFRAGDAARYFEEFLLQPPDLSDRDALFLVPAPLLPEAARAVAGTPLALGGLNLHWEDKGAFTGEVSGPMLAAAGASYCLVGHSERRHLFGEDDGVVARKLRAALRNGLRPLVCVGEQLAERRAGSAAATVLAQLAGALEGLEPADLERVTVAYEPVWAIGTGETATPEIAAAMHAEIREAFAGLAGAELAARLRILYGGSVTSENVDGLLNQPELDGALVGGASLQPQAFRRIVDAGRAAASGGAA
jgi:triosephosphate isomerase